MQSHVPHGVQYDEQTGERLRREVRELTLPPVLADLADLYEEVVDVRDRFLWKWLYHVFGDDVVLSCVADRHAAVARETKTILAIYDTLLDDLAEQHGDLVTFWELASVAYPGRDPDWDRPDVDQDYARVTKAVWEAAEDRMRAAPRYEEFRDPTMFDLRQVFSAMDYSHLLAEQPEIANLGEAWRYGPSNLMMYVFAHADLMHSPSFSMTDYADLREVLAVAQEMWRVGNWVITWEREIEEGDYSAGVVVEALRQGLVSVDSIRGVKAGNVSPEAVRRPIRESGIEESFIDEWTRRRDALRAREDDLETVDVAALVDGMERLLQQHFATRGHR